MIEVERLTKVYGNRVAVWEVSFRVDKGEILGFLGPNGAGKTTTMRMITGFVPASAGTARVSGYDVGESPREVKARIGYLCEMPPVYREMVVRSYLRFVAEIKHVPRTRVRSYIDRAVELCGLNEVADRVIGHLSRGYRQRVGLAQAIIHEPPVLILDEPTSALDPRQITEIRQLIRRLAGEQTVILSTHILPEVTVTCSRVVIINEGQVVAEDSIENLTRGYEARETVRLQVARDGDNLGGRLSEVPGVLEVHRGEDGVYLVSLDGGKKVRERLTETVVSAGAGVLEITRQTASLEEVFLKLVTEESAEEPS